MGKTVTPSCRQPCMCVAWHGVWNRVCAPPPQARLSGGGPGRYLVQGTLYPDVIESCPPPGSGRKHSHTIKSHHNVGGLPKDLKFTLIEPLRELFKARWRPCQRCLSHVTR